MNPLTIFNRSFTMKLISMSLFIVVVSALLTALFFYFTLDRGLGETYGEKIRMLSFYKFEMLRKSFFIFISFALISLIAIIVFGILYTHRITGPLYRTRIIAKEIADGKFDINVRFRENDAINPVAESLNRFARMYGERYSSIGNLVNELHNDAAELNGLIQKGDNAGAAARRATMAKRAEELKGILSNIKV